MLTCLEMHNFHLIEFICAYMSRELVWGGYRLGEIPQPPKPIPSGLLTKQVSGDRA